MTPAGLRWLQDLRRELLAPPTPLDIRPVHRRAARRCLGDVALTHPNEKDVGPGVYSARETRPHWVRNDRLIDFETTLPSAVEELARQRDERRRA
jgi:hypothetical protein